MSAEAFNHRDAPLLGRQNEDAAHRAISGTMRATVARVGGDWREGEEAKVCDGGGEDGSVAGGEKARRKKVEAGRRGDEADEEGGREEEQAHRRRGDQRARAALRRPTRKCQWHLHPMTFRG